MFYVILEEEGLLGPSMGTEKFMNLGPRKGGGGGVAVHYKIIGTVTLFEFQIVDQGNLPCLRDRITIWRLAHCRKEAPLDTHRHCPYCGYLQVKT